MPSTHSLFPLLLLFLTLSTYVYASSGDRNPTFQHCLKGCQLTYCQPSQPLLPFHLRLLGWTCPEDCAYSCAHSFTDNIRPGSRYHQFYGKWAFTRLAGIQEPFSVLMSLGNLWVNLRGLSEIRRRIRKENRLRRWMEALSVVQINTWVWSAVFHSRDTPITERLDYFSATLTIGFTLLYSLIRIFNLQTPLSSSRSLPFVVFITACVILGHFTYLLTFPRHAFPYGYHTTFNLFLGLIHNLTWSLFSLSFLLPLPSLTLGTRRLAWPKPYPPKDPLPPTPKPSHYFQPFLLVVGTTLAMGLELFDFAPIFRMIDAHSLWHAATIPLTVGWYGFLCADAIELEGSLLSRGGGGGGGVGLGLGISGTDDHNISGSSGNGGGMSKSSNLLSTPKLPLSQPTLQAPKTPEYRQLAANGPGSAGRARSPSNRSPEGRGSRMD